MWEKRHFNPLALQLPQSLATNTLIRVQNPDENSFDCGLEDQFSAAFQWIRSYVWSAWLQGCVNRRFGKKRAVFFLYVLKSTVLRMFIVPSGSCATSPPANY